MFRMIFFQIFSIHLFIGGKSDEHEISSTTYASIGPPHENSEIKNRIENNSEIRSVGLATKPEMSVAPPDPPPQIPGTDSLSTENPEIMRKVCQPFQIWLRCQLQVLYQFQVLYQSKSMM